MQRSETFQPLHLWVSQKRLFLNRVEAAAAQNLEAASFFFTPIFIRDNKFFDTLDVSNFKKKSDWKH